MNNKTIAEMILAVALVVTVIAVLAIASPSEDGDDEAYIVHTGDTGGQTGGLGFDNVAEIREGLGSRAFLFDTGNALQGTGMNMVTQGDATVQIMNAAGYDAVCLGPHDFSYTPDELRKRVDSMDFPVVCANLVWESDGKPVFGDYAVIEKNGVKLGVFGLITPDIIDVIKPNYLDGMVLKDPAQVAAEMVEVLEGEKVDHVVAIGSLGPDHGGRYSAESIVMKTAGIDIFLEGYYGPSEGRSFVVNDTLISTAGYGFSEVGVVKLGKDQSSAHITGFTGSDDATRAEIEKQEERTQQFLDKVIGHSQVEIYGGDRTSFVSEVTMGDFAADAMVRASGADVAILNGGFIRASIHPGDITAGMVCNAFPFANTIVTMKVTGETLTEVLEWGLRGYPAENGGFPQVSGMEVTWDPDAKPMDRVVSVTIGGQPLDLGKTYTLATSDYMSSGGDGYSMLSGIPVDREFGMAYQTVIEYVQFLGDVKEIKGERLLTV